METFSIKTKPIFFHALTDNLYKEQINEKEIYPLTISDTILPLGITYSVQLSTNLYSV